mgnify:CR=1 FL=1
MHDSDRLGPERPGYGAAPAQGSQSFRLAAGPEVFDQNDTDMTPQLTKMKEAKVDFIIAVLAGAGRRADRQEHAEDRAEDPVDRRPGRSSRRTSSSSAARS